MEAGQGAELARGSDPPEPPAGRGSLAQVIATRGGLAAPAATHFMFLERPEGMDIDDANGLAALARAAPLMSDHDIAFAVRDTDKPRALADELVDRTHVAASDLG